MSELSWWANDESDAAYGLRCGTPWMQGYDEPCTRCDGRHKVWSITLACEVDCPRCTGKLYASSVDDGGPLSPREPNEKGPAERAYAKEQPIRKKLANCTRPQRRVLELAFRRREGVSDMKSLGEFPGAAWACPKKF